MRAYRGVTLALAAVTVGLGVALVAATVARGSAGLLLGALFVLAGGGRLYAERRRAR